MSSLWSVRTEETGVDTVTLRVDAVHPDAGDLPQSAVFALRLLTDREPHPARLIREQGEGAYQDEEVIARTAGRVVAEVTVTEKRNFPFREREVQAGILDGLRARGLDPSDLVDWAAAIGQEWRAFWRDPDRRPSAVFTVRVADPEWLAGLGVGDSWDSAAYG